MLKIKKYILHIIFGVIIVVAILGFSKFLQQINLFILVLTLGVLIWYAYDTNRIANQTIENNLRPLILRSGYIKSWEDIKFSTTNRKLNGDVIEFSILKNIAKDISGYIIINSKKYKLLFANYISSKDIKDKSREYSFLPNWGWMNKGTIINAIFDSCDYEETKEDNQIYLIYFDMAGNKYFTLEDKNWSQDSGHL